MTIPPVAAVTIRVDGRPIHAYLRAVIIAGRTYAPVVPYLTSVAGEISYQGRWMVLERGGREVRIRMYRRMAPDALDRDYVAIVPLFRALGASVEYNACTRTISVVAQRAWIVATPTPFNPSEPEALPRLIFTPTPIPVPHPIWTGSPQPRRTPLPYPLPT